MICFLRWHKGPATNSPWLHVDIGKIYFSWNGHFSLNCNAYADETMQRTKNGARPNYLQQ